MRKHFTKFKPHTTLPPPVFDDDDRPSFTYYPCYPVAFEPPRLQIRGGVISYTPHVFYNCYIDLKEIGSFDGYLQRLSPKTRSTLRRKVRKLEALSGGKLDFRVYSKAEEIGEFYPRALSVSLKTYQESLLDCGLPKHEGFLNELKMRCEEGAAIGYLLYLNGQPVAYELSYLSDRVASFDFVGFDPQYAQLSVGAVLMFLLIQDLFTRDNVSIFDFTEGEGQQKSSLSTHKSRCAKTYLLRASLTNRARIHLHIALDYVSNWMVSFLDRFGLKTRIRRWLRKHDSRMAL